MIAALALGSNLASPWGSPAANLQEALRRLGALGTVQAASSFYVTAPVGYLDQADFTNAAALLETALDPRTLLYGLLAVEQGMGRDRSGRDRSTAISKGPRIIDLDLLFYISAGGSVILHDTDLVLPHPALHERRFVLEPLAEIAPALMHPVLHRTVAELLAALPASR